GPWPDSRDGVRPSMGKCYGRASGNDSVRLDLDQPARVEEIADDDHRRGWTDVGEDLAVGSADLRPVLGPFQVDARTHDVLRGRAELRQRREDDLEAPLRLAVRVGRRISAVRHDRCRPGHRDEIAYTYR